jgi:hypothetical protein
MLFRRILQTPGYRQVVIFRAKIERNAYLACLAGYKNPRVVISCLRAVYHLQSLLEAMPPRRRRAAGNLSATPQSSSDSMDSIVYTAAQTAAPEASQDSVNVELDPKSPFVEVLTSDDEVTICDPPPIQPTHTAEVVIVSTPEKEANVSKLCKMSSIMLPYCCL